MGEHSPELRAAAAAAAHLGVELDGSANRATADADLTAAGDLFFHAFGGRFGDHRDWPTIDAWADQIAVALPSLRSTSPV